MRQPTLGGKPQQTMLTVKNSDTVVIPPGSPVVYIFNGTDDDIAVVLPSTAGANKYQTLFAGVYPGFPGAIGTYIDVIAFGMVTNAKLTLATRASSTGSFNSYAAVAAGDALTVDSIGNGFLWASSGSSFTGPALPNFMLAQSLASGASAASTTANTSTSVTAAVKVFLRNM